MEMEIKINRDEIRIITKWYDYFITYTNHETKDDKDLMEKILKFMITIK